jgi:hypothetical protein
MAHPEREPSLPRQRRGFTVAASPFNGVKLDLALIIIVGVVVWLIHDRVIENGFGQMLLLAGYGLCAMIWIVLKTRRIARSGLTNGKE